jgi:hypothetical protein
MRYFTYIAEQSFKTDSQGQEFFYLGTPFSRPYLVEDEETRARLFRKMTWHLRVFLGAMILGQPFLIRYFFQRPWLFFAYSGAVLCVQWLALRVLFHRDLRVLRRAPARLSFRAFYTSMAQRHSKAALLLGFLGSIAFVVSSIPMLFLGGGMLAVAITCASFFAACALAWGYALHLKHSEAATPSPGGSQD